MLLGGTKDKHFSYFHSSCQLGLRNIFCFFCNVFAGQQVSQNEFDNEYGTMSMGVGRFFQDFDDYQIEDEAQTVNETIPVSIASMLW